jgi:hypothetical protein
MAEKIFKAFPALGSAMHGNARGLVKDERLAVAIKQSRTNLFRRHAGQAIEG